MGNTIYKNIKEYKNGNKEIFREIINVFNPLINKLSKSVNWEDTRQDLLVHLLEIINKFKTSNSDSNSSYSSSISKFNSTSLFFILSFFLDNFIYSYFNALDI